LWSFRKLNSNHIAYTPQSNIFLGKKEHKDGGQEQKVREEWSNVILRSTAGRDKHYMEWKGVGRQLQLGEEQERRRGVGTVGKRIISRDLQGYKRAPLSQHRTPYPLQVIIPLHLRRGKADGCKGVGLDC
jgi:hypothetical protein